MHRTHDWCADNRFVANQYNSGGEFAGMDFYRVFTHTDGKTYEMRISGFVWEIREVNRAYTLVAAGDLATVT